MIFTATKYQLKTVATGRVFDDEGWTLDDKECPTPSMVRPVYENKQLDVKEGACLGLYRYADWLPIKTMLNHPSEPITYKSEGLARRLGLRNLYITFNGWWPERGAKMTTCSFKEMEAFSVCARLGEEQRNKVLVVASAGNTARAFAKVCSDNGIKLLLCVPQDNIKALWFDKPLNPCVKLITTESGSDYFDAINLSNVVCELDGYLAEGGAKNIARRDGMGTTMMSAATFIGRTPDFYFQAVGSGTGAIAAWEANLRFIEDGRFGANKARLMVSQNKPFLPMYEAWKADSRALLPYDADQARKDAAEICAPVLSNRKPPYGLAGGLYDALKDTNGDILAVSNAEADAAKMLFEETEGIDIYHAAAVATASLQQAIEKKMVKADDVVMLNVTGGGEKRFHAEHEIHHLQPTHIFKIGFTKEEVERVLAEMK
ncbi:MAG: cysteate synthase [Bacteroidales bacterium]|nr:cysteate synthase [Bacteroidales bacterium]MBR0539214.1 cysteate synthase [Bacteroidales bacterium]